MRMARVPHSATLFDNSVSLAPGFQIENVFVLAGVPTIAQSMFEGASKRLRRGTRLHSRSIRCHAGAGTVADPLEALQAEFPEVHMGSYPWSKDGAHGTSLVLRSGDIDQLNDAFDRVYAMVDAIGGRPQEE